MDTKIEVAVDLLARIKQDRIKVANSERCTIPAALRMGLSVERVAHLTGASMERVEEVRGEAGSG